MNEIYKSIETTKKNLEYHRRMSLIYLLMLVAIVASYILIEVLSTVYENTAMNSFASALKNTSIPEHISIKVDQPKDFNLPDDLEIDLTDAYSSVSAIKISLPSLIVTLFLIFAVFGFMRHHLRRVSLAEDRLFFLERIAPILMTDGVMNSNALSTWVGASTDIQTKDSVEPSFHPGFEVLEKSIDMLSSIKNDVKKKYKN